MVNYYNSIYISTATITTSNVSGYITDIKDGKKTVTLELTNSSDKVTSVVVGGKNYSDINEAFKSLSGAGPVAGTIITEDEAGNTKTTTLSIVLS